MFENINKIWLWWLLWISVIVFITIIAGDYRIPILVGFLLAYILEPLGAFGQKFSIPRWITAVFVLLVIILIQTLLFALVVPKIGQEIGQLILELPERFNQLGNWLASSLANILEKTFVLFPNEPPIWIKELHQELLKSSVNTNTNLSDNGLQRILALWFGDDKFKEINSLNDFASVTNSFFYTYGSFISNFITSLRSGLLGLFDFSLSFILIIVVYFFVFVGWNSFGSYLIDVVPASAYTSLSNILKRCDAVLAGYFRGMFILVSVMSSYYTALYLLIGVPYALILGLITGLLTFIPILGMLASLTLLLIVTLFPFSSLLITTLGVSALLAGQVIENFILTPRLVGRYIGLHPLVTVFSIAIFAQLWGVAGTLIAIPVTGIVFQLLAMTNSWLNK